MQDEWMKQLREAIPRILEEYGIPCGVSIEKYGDRLIYGQELVRAIDDFIERHYRAATTPTEEQFVFELAAIYGLDDNFMRALPVPTLEMWKMLVREEAKRHKSEQETMEKFRAELNVLKFGARAAMPTESQKEIPVDDEYMKNFGGAPNESWSEMTIDNEGVAWVLRSEAEVRIAAMTPTEECTCPLADRDLNCPIHSRAATKAGTCPTCGSGNPKRHNIGKCICPKNKKWKLGDRHEDSCFCTDPWHSPAPAPQKEKR